MSDHFERDILERVENLEALSGGVAEMVVGLVMEQYAQNVLSIEQESLGADFLEKTNEDLLARMATILALKTLTEGKPQNKTRDQLVEGIKGSLRRSVNEILEGVQGGD